MIKDYFFLALGNLRHRGLRSWLTILGIFIGIAAVVALISMGAGLKTAVLGQFGTLAFDILNVQNKGVGFAPPGSTVVEKLHDHDVKLIEGINGVERVIPKLIRVGSLEYNGVAGFGYAADIPEKQEDIDFIYERFGFEAEQGKLLEEGDSGKILLGSNFLEDEDFGKKFSVGKTVKIEGETFEIGGILKKTGSFQLNSIVVIANDDLEKLLDIEDEWDLIAVQVEDRDEIESVGKEIERKLRRDRNEKIGEETFSVETPLQSLSAVNNILNIINALVIGIAMLSLVVGGVGISNTMYTSVVERTKEIGIMKSVGAKNSDILWVFLIEAGLLGLVGGVVGALIGLFGAIGISNLANSSLGGDLFIVSVSYPLLLGAIGFSFLIGIVSGVLPALQASRLSPVEALRK